MTQIKNLYFNVLRLWVEIKSRSIMRLKKAAALINENRNSTNSCQKPPKKTPYYSGIISLIR